MISPIKEFCEKYKEKLENDKKINSPLNIPYYNDFIKRIYFRVTYVSRAPGDTPSLFSESFSTITLDDEDLKYLYNKYRNKLSIELDNKIQDLIKDYSSILND